MVKKSTGNTGKYLNSNWHRVRWLAETTSFSIDEWSDIDITKYDLDSVEFSRKYKDSTYISEEIIEAEGGAEGGFDRREFPQFD